MGFLRDVERFWNEMKEDVAKRAYRRAHGVDPPGPHRTRHEQILDDSSSRALRSNSNTPGDRAGAVPDSRLLRVTGAENLSVLGTQLAQVAEDIQAYYDRARARLHASSTIHRSTNRLTTPVADSQENDPVLPPPPYNEEDERRRAQWLRTSISRARNVCPDVPQRTSSRSRDNISARRLNKSSSAARTPEDATAATLPFYIRTIPPASPTNTSSPATALERLPDFHIFGCSDDSHLLDCRLRMAEVERYYCRQSVAFRECRNGWAK